MAELYEIKGFIFANQSICILLESRHFVIAKEIQARTAVIKIKKIHTALERFTLFSNKVKKEAIKVHEIRFY